VVAKDADEEFMCSKPRERERDAERGTDEEEVQFTVCSYAPLSLASSNADSRQS